MKCARVNVDVVGGLRPCYVMLESFPIIPKTTTFSPQRIIIPAKFNGSHKIYILSPYFIDHIFYGISQFPLQNKAVECCSTLFKPHKLRKI